MTTTMALNASAVAGEANISRARDLFPIIEYHAPYAIVINKCVTPVFYAIGLVGNVISALFWSSQRIRTCNTAAVYLTALALADFSYLFLHVFYELEYPWFVHTLNVAGWCQLWNWLYMAAQYFCVFLVCAFTIERFLSVCHPFKSERFGRRRSPRIIVVLLFAALALASPQAYFWIVSDSECHVRKNEVAKATFYSIWSWCTDMLIFGALPVLVLVLNVGVLKKIRSAGKLRLSSTRSIAGYSRVSMSGKQGPRTGSNYALDGGGKTLGGSGGGNGGAGGNLGGGGGEGSDSLVNNGTSPKTASTAAAAASAATNTTTTTTTTSSAKTGGNHNFTTTTVTLLWVSFFLIFTTLPVTIMFAIQTAIQLGDPMPLEDMARDPTWRRYIDYFAARVIIREIGMSHYVGNVFIYLATSRRFRFQLRQLLFNGRSCGGDHTQMTSLHSTQHQPLKSHKSNACR